MWILLKIRLWKCEFCEKWYFQNVNFWINWGFLPQCALAYFLNRILAPNSQNYARIKLLRVMLLYMWTENNVGKKKAIYLSRSACSLLVASAGDLSSFGNSAISMLIAVESSAILSSLVFQLCKETMISSVLLHSATQQSQFYQTSSDTPARNSPNSAKLMTNETWHISQNLKSFCPWSDWSLDFLQCSALLSPLRNDEWIL